MKPRTSIPPHYREMIVRTLNERIQVNPRYSLRAFARDLKLSPATLSLLLSGKKGLSTIAAERIAEKLGFSAQEVELFRISVSAAHARSKVVRRAAQARLAVISAGPNSISLELDAFCIVSDWHHFAILQLVFLRGFREDPDWIAGILGIRADEAKNAIDRLLRLELLSRNTKGKLKAQDAIFASDGISSEAIRKFHRQVLEKAISAVSLQSVDERYLKTTLLPVRRSDFAKAAQALREAQDSFTEKFHAGDEGDAVYAVSVQYFNLTPQLTKIAKERQEGAVK